MIALGEISFGGKLLMMVAIFIFVIFHKPITTFISETISFMKGGDV